MKIFSCEQIKEIDEYTIQHEPIASIDLMERAAGQLLKWYLARFERSRRIFIFAGPGNNGGDGLALARMLAANRYDAEVHYVKFTEKTSNDWEINRQRLETETTVPLNYLTSSDQFPVISSGDLIIDAIFGSGLSRPVEGLPGDVIKQINRVDATVISIDIPSGLFGEDNSKNSYDTIVKADYILSFHFPKLSFMFAENAPYVGEWFVLQIGLNSNAIRNTLSPYALSGNNDVAPLLKKRNQFDHKGNFGHGLLVSGSSGKMGAAVLGAGAALRTGIGLITCHIPSCGNLIIQSALPEAMMTVDKSEKYISDIGNTDSFSAVGIGPGLGTEPVSQKALHNLLSECKKPMVIDADALNILSLNKKWFSLLPTGTILTPHPKEFERLAGKTDSGFARLKRQIQFSEENKCIVVLKGAHTSVTTPEGKVMFNSTGNPGMATGGSGDVLTGIILSLLAQGYAPENAAVLGVYLHGMAGDMAAGESCYESIIASDIIKCIGKAFNKIRELEPSS
ncbi:MAG: NAD(P)H-hydrate dehydratase [Bacteroidales bacterium]|nr:NAD(P)H-hydrate dehydratase [Bacteroidales bacterium]